MNDQERALIAYRMERAHETISEAAAPSYLRRIGRHTRTSRMVNAGTA